MPAERFRPATAAVLGFLTGFVAVTLCLAGIAHASMLGFRNADFNILSGNGSKIIGSVHYDVRHDSSGIATVDSVARYFDGQSDVEHDVFARSSAGDGPPPMVSFRHDFFHADGSLFLSSRVNFRTGEATCIDLEEGSLKTTSQILQLTQDAYAGAAMILPLQYALAHGQQGPIAMHGFSCAGGPRLFAVRADAHLVQGWGHFTGALIRADIKPDFGWLGYLIAPFVPEMHAWFAPSGPGNLAFVGADFSRYYKGPEIILSRVDNASAGQMPAGPASTTLGAHTIEQTTPGPAGGKAG